MNIEDWKTELYMLKSVVVKGGVAPYALRRVPPQISVGWATRERELTLRRPPSTFPINLREPQELAYATFLIY